MKNLQKWSGNARYSDSKNEIDEVRAFLSDPNRRLARDRPAKVAEDLVMNWADFVVTGEFAPVARILDGLDKPVNLREKINERLEAPVPKKDGGFDLMAFLGDFKLLQPGTMKLVPGDLELVMLYDRKGRIRGAGLILMGAVGFASEISDDQLTQDLGCLGVASMILETNLDQQPKLRTLLEKNYQTRSKRIQEIVKRWLRIGQPAIPLDEEATKLRGTWQAVRCLEDGDKSDPAIMAEILKYLRWTFDEDEVSMEKAWAPTIGNKTEVHGQGRTSLCTFRIDAAKNPKVMVLTSIDARWGETYKALHKLEGDTLTVCWKTDLQGVPADFAGGPGTGCTLVTLKKTAAPKPGN